RFSVDFKFVPVLKSDRLQQELNRQQEERIRPSDQTLLEGWLWIGAAGRIRRTRKNDFVNLMLGCYFAVDLSSKKWTRRLFAEVVGKGSGGPKEHWTPALKTFPSEESASRELTKLARTALQDAAETAPHAITKRRIQALAKAIK